MKTVILCGGLGTRLREHTESLPKPMVEIGGRPMVWHIMKMYAQHRLTDFVLCLGYKGEVIRDYFVNYRAMQSDCTVALGSGDVEVHGEHDEQDWRVTLASTGAATMTGGRVARVKKYTGDERFCLTYGDGVSDIDLTALLRFHAAHGKTATVVGVSPPGRFGELSIDDGRVTSFAEKPADKLGMINGGFFVCEPAFHDYLSTDAGCILERAPLEQLAKDGQLMVYPHSGFWQCVDTFRDLNLLSRLWDDQSAPWASWLVDVG